MFRVCRDMASEIKATTLLSLYRVIYSDKLRRALLMLYASNNPANTTRCPNAGLMLPHRLRRWGNISPALGQRVVFAGLSGSVNALLTSKCSHLSFTARSHHIVNEK